MVIKSESITLTVTTEFNDDEHSIIIPNEIAKLMEIDLDTVLEVKIRKIEKSNG